ncbi:autotransporter domain-containing protein [Mesorhizobium sp. B2-3-4]|uniref:autotransporter outer membrane beta-barrel domain-containing protein n=1 Tax=Mesorhizobium sp. B2-3-4 TaxID=2589959 RepID=UPI00112B44A6|nr:autotransporter domain-containing protein [Mesorhizobium sp. B2-3-4]TPM38713.1 autotransporter outer membrane beta-barrel domain-containing protein [Mesorhizobium sp. B2-3-4]
MNIEKPRPFPASLAVRRRWLLVGTALAGLALAGTPAVAQQWTGATSSDYTDATNWTGGTTPNSTVAPVIFGSGASTTTVNLDTPYPAGYYSAGSVTFNDPGSAYTINVSNTAYLNISGGVSNTSGLTQNFTVTGDSGTGAASEIIFNNSDAGSNVVYTVNAYGTVQFNSVAGSASGADAAFVLNGGAVALSGSGTLALGSVEGSGILSYYGNPGGSSGTFQIGGLNTSTTFNAQIQEQTGSLSIEKVGSGTLTLDGASTYSGGTILSGGTLLIANDAALGTGGLTMASGTTFGASGGARTFAQAVALETGSETIDTSNGDLTLSSGIGESGGPASLTKLGDGTLTINGPSTYSGGTNLYGGTLSVGNDSALGSGAVYAGGGTTIDIQDGITVNNDLTIYASMNLNVGSGATGTYTGLISEFSDPSAIMKTGAGTLVLTNNDNSFSSGAIIKQGTIQVTADHALGSGPITLDGGTLQAGANLTLANLSILFGPAGGTIDTNGFDVSTSASMGETDTPSGTFTKTGAGTLTVDGFAGNNTYATATDVAQGTLKAATANIFSANSAYTVESGAALSLNNFSQAIGSLAGAGSVELGTATLTTGGKNTDTVFSGAITGTGGLTKAGSGTFELSGDSGAFTGATTVQAGTLLVTGNLAGSVVTVDDGATLEGDGSIGGLVAKGIVEPGKNAIDTLTVKGNVSFTAGSTYAVDLNTAGASDLINATGAATISGGANLTLTNSGVYVPGQYTVLHADGGLLGNKTFTIIDPQVSYFLAATIGQDLNDIYVDIAQNRSLGSAGSTPNQVATAGGLESVGGGALTGAILALPSAEAAQAAFDQLSGEIHASAKGMLLQDSHFLQDAVTARLRGAFGDSGKTASLPVMAYGEDGVQPVAADTDRFAFWSQGFGSWGGTDSDGNAAAFDRSTGGLLVGADGLVGDWRIGVVGGYSRTSFDADDRRSSGDSDNYHLGLYGGTNWGAIAFRTGAAYTWNRISTSRSVAFQGFTDSLSADYDAATAQAFGELAYKTDAGPFAFEPFANLAYVNLRTDGFSETGGDAALTSGSSTSDATFTTLGARASTDITIGGVAATARAMFGWRHAFGDVTPLSTFAFAGGDNFTIAGVPIARDAMLVEAGFDVQLARNATLGLSYAGQFGPDAFDNGFKANLGIKF